MLITDLPNEIILTIESNLAAVDILSLSATNFYFRDFYNRSVLLQYIVELHAAACCDPRSLSTALSQADGSPTIYERLQYLRCRESKWHEFNISRRFARIDIRRRNTIYDLSGGAYVLGEDNPYKFGLRYLDLAKASELSPINDTSKPLQPIHLPQSIVESIPLEGDPVDFGLNLPEYELIAYIMIRPKNADALASNTVLHSQNLADDPHMQAQAVTLNEVILRLSHFPSGNPHPLAREPAIHVMNTDQTTRRCSLNLEISGQFLLLLVRFSRQGLHNFGDKLLLINWLTGEKLFELRSPTLEYTGFTFLSEKVFVLANVIDSVLEVVEIVPPPDGDSNTKNHSYLRWLKALGLPIPYFTANTLHVACRADPNPIVGYHDKFRWCSGMHSLISDPAKAIVVFNVSFWSVEGNGVVEETFVAHRESLLRLAQDAALGVESPSNEYMEQGEDSGTIDEDAEVTMPMNFLVQLQNLQNGAAMLNDVNVLLDGLQAMVDAHTENNGGFENAVIPLPNPIADIPPAGNNDHEDEGDDESDANDDEDEDDLTDGNSEDDDYPFVHEDEADDEDDDEDDGNDLFHHFMGNDEHQLHPRNAYKTVNWASWGPEFTRWNEPKEKSSDYITTSSGQRYVVWDSEKREIVVKDFNSRAIRRRKADAICIDSFRSEEGELSATADPSNSRDTGHPDSSLGFRLVESESRKDVTWRARKLASKLPYIEYRFKVSQDKGKTYTALMIDDERILAFFDDEDKGENYVDIFTINTHGVQKSQPSSTMD